MVQDKPSGTKRTKFNTWGAGNTQRCTPTARAPCVNNCTLSHTHTKPNHSSRGTKQWKSIQNASHTELTCCQASNQPWPNFALITCFQTVINSPPFTIFQGTTSLWNGVGTQIVPCGLLETPFPEIVNNSVLTHIPHMTCIQYKLPFTDAPLGSFFIGPLRWWCVPAVLPGLWNGATWDRTLHFKVLWSNANNCDYCSCA